MNPEVINTEPLEELKSSLIFKRKLHQTTKTFRKEQFMAPIFAYYEYGKISDIRRLSDDNHRAIRR